MIEIIISGIILFLLVAINNILRTFKNYLLILALSATLPFAVHYFFPTKNVDYLSFFLPFFHLLFFQIFRQIFLRFKKREMIFYIRGIYLSSKEEEIVSYIDIIASISLIFIPIVLTILIHSY